MATLIQEALETAPAITFEDVWVGFDEGQVLRGVTFQVRERETLVLLGETGTGKTLTLKMAAGLLAPNRGSGWRVEGRSGSCFGKARCSTRCRWQRTWRTACARTTFPKKRSSRACWRCCDSSNWNKRWSCFLRNCREDCDAAFRSPGR